MLSFRSIDAYAIEQTQINIYDLSVAVMLHLFAHIYDYKWTNVSELKIFFIKISEKMRV